MRIAVLADTHGNLPALQAALADLPQVRPDLVVINGDLINRGPSGRAVIEQLWDSALSSKMRFTLGNHDDFVIKWKKRDPGLSELYGDALFGAVEWVSKEVPQSHLDWLGTLPYEIFLGGIGVRISHGSPRHYREGYGESLGDAAFDEIVAEFPARVLVGSHTHKPYVRERGGTLMLNTGAAGASFNGDPRVHYLVLEVEGGKVRHNLRLVNYDLEAAKRSFITSGLLEEGGLSAEIFYWELCNARSMLTPFWLWTEEEGRPRDRENWKAFQAAHPERLGY